MHEQVTLMYPGAQDSTGPRISSGFPLDLIGESAFTYQVRSFVPVCVAAITRIGAPLAKAPNVLKVPTPVPISALPEITACWVSPAPWV